MAGDGNSLNFDLPTFYFGVLQSNAGTTQFNSVGNERNRAHLES